MRLLIAHPHYLTFVRSFVQSFVLLINLPMMIICKYSFVNLDKNMDEYFEILSFFISFYFIHESLESLKTGTKLIL